MALHRAGPRHAAGPGRGRRRRQLRSLAPDTDNATHAKVQAAARQKILSKPLIVAVAYLLSGDTLQRREDYAATCCAIQNVQLAAWAEGLGMQWNTGKQPRQPQTYTLLGIDPAEEGIAGLLYFGYPAVVPPACPAQTPEQGHAPLAVTA